MRIPEEDDAALTQKREWLPAASFRTGRWVKNGDNLGMGCLLSTNSGFFGVLTSKQILGSTEEVEHLHLEGIFNPTELEINPTAAAILVSGKEKTNILNSN